MIIVKRQMQLHHAVSVIGGFLGGYTVFNHCDIFANAQTGNLIKLVIGLFGLRLESVAFMASYFLLYAAGNAFYAVARKKLKLSMKIVSFIITAVGILLVGVLNFTGNSYFAVMPVFFLAPVQWNAFKTAGGNSSSTIFSSNNVRQAVILLTRYIMERNPKDLRNGVASSVLLSLFFGVHSIWFCLIAVGIAAAFYYRYQAAKIKAFT